MRTSLIAACLVLACAVSASAQDLKLPTTIFAGAVAADFATTAVNLSCYCGLRERNPMLSWLHDDPIQTVTTGAAMAAAGTWAFNRYVGRKHPRIAAIALYIGAAVEIGIASRNVYRLKTRTTVQNALPCGLAFCRN